METPARPVPPKPAEVPRPPEEPPPELSLAPPDLNLPSPEPSPRPREPAAPAEPQTPIEIPEAGGEEKMEMAPAHEFVGWKPPEGESGLASAEPEGEDIFAQKEKLEPVSLTPVAAEVKLSKPESAEEDFWQEAEMPAAPVKTLEPGPESDEERLPFEKPLEPPEPPPLPTVPPPKDDFLGSLEEVTGDQQEMTGPLYGGEPAREIPATAAAPGGLGEEPGEMSLEFAVKTIRELKDELKEREFQMDELIGLMMKKEIGEITTEIYMKELALIKKQMDKLKSKKP